MCIQKPPHDYAQQFYDKYQKTFEEHITSTVLPSLKAKHDEFLLQEFVKSWADHKVMLRWMSRAFSYLDRYFLTQRSLLGLNEVALKCYRDLVYREVNADMRVAALRLINKEREGGEIDRALLHPSSEKMLVGAVKHWLLVVYANQLIGKKHSESGWGGGCLTVDNIEELSRKFIAAVVLEQQAPARCSTLYQQAEDELELELLKPALQIHGRY